MDRETRIELAANSLEECRLQINQFSVPGAQSCRPTQTEFTYLSAGLAAVLDLYMWLTYRCCKATSTATISNFGEFGFAGHIGTVEYSRSRPFPRNVGIAWDAL